MGLHRSWDEPDPRQRPSIEPCRTLALQRLAQSRFFVLVQQASALGHRHDPAESGRPRVEQHWPVSRRQTPVPRYRSGGALAGRRIAGRSPWFHDINAPVTNRTGAHPRVSPAWKTIRISVTLLGEGASPDNRVEWRTSFDHLAAWVVPDVPCEQNTCAVLEARSHPRTSWPGTH